MRRLIKLSVIAFASVLVLAVIALRLYLPTPAFSAKIAERATNALGIPIEFKQKIQVHAVFPRIKVGLPSVHLKMNDTAEQIRVRLTDVTIELSTVTLMLFGELGDLKVSVDNISAIASGRAKSHLPVLDSLQQLPNLITLFKRVLAQPSELTVDSVTLISRRSDEVKTQKLNHLNLISADKTVDLDVMLVNESQPVPLSLSMHLQQGENSQVDAGGYSVSLTVHSKEIIATTLSANIRQNGDSISLQQISLIQGENVIEGDLAIARLNNTELAPVISGLLNIKRLDLARWKTPFFAATHSLGNNHHVSRIFGRQTIPYGLLTQAESDIELRVGAFRIDGQPLVNGIFLLKTDSSSLSITSQDASSMGALLKLEFSGKTLGRDPHFLLSASLSDVQITRIGSMIGEEGLFDEGQGMAQLKLAYRGTTPLDHAQTLDGSININVSNAHLTASFSQWLDRGIISHVSGIALKKNKEFASSGREISCINALIDIEDGYATADKSILIETPHNLLISSGYTDFHSEEHHYTFISDTKNFIDWSPMGMVKYIRIGGTIASPKVIANEKEVAKKGAMTAVSLFAGPIPGLAFSAVNAVRKRTGGKPACIPIS